MRKSVAMEMNESILGTEQPNHVNKNKSKRCCLAAIWLMSNILTLTIGYYVKTKYFKDNCLVDEGGSL